ncbi:DUF192 domain-containing protein [Sphingomonas sp. LaA6.9]|uniref:DUF192 domain-containing protein n=1 Tax=Sphingomonas sp. LaA6.9 TaxID=2919914 RepID=UPI001F4F909E|nr:DUF192 domain-containing protein [Sphingomonas sp. LaA6.9]MCJ8157144.1 DUF192 domain-containing protein [Sphingomonas sp. LaA6.9]
MTSKCLLAALGAVMLVAGCGTASNAVSAASAEEQALLPLSVKTAKGVHNFRVEVARTSEEQAQGLMYRTSLPDDGGMLFPFSPPRPASFWMKNTLIPLDMIFIRADGSIARIAEETVPQSLEGVSSGEPVAAVLEIAGGRSAALGIAEGDHVSWKGGPSLPE